MKTFINTNYFVDQLNIHKVNFLSILKLYRNLLLLLRFVNKVLDNPYLQNLDEVLTTKDLVS